MSQEKIATIHGGRKPNEPSKAIIESLEGLLAEARSGDLIAIAYCTIRDSGEPTNPVQGTGWDGEAGTKHSLGTVIMMLQTRYFNAMLDQKDK